MSLKALEKKLSYHFEDPKAFCKALEHPSLRQRGEVSAYQRYEFLGDRIVGLLVASMLFDAYPDQEEGFLAKAHSHFVCRETLAEIAEELSLGLHVMRSNTIHRTGENASLLADAFESLVGYIYQEAGFDKCVQLFKPFWQKRIQEIPSFAEKNPKSAVQEWAQQQQKPIPTYELIKKSGLEHQPHFLVELKVKGCAPVLGEGNSMRAAERQAAALFLETMKQRKEDL